MARLALSAALFGLSAMSSPAFAAALFDPPVVAAAAKCETCVMKMRPVAGLALDPTALILAPQGAPKAGAGAVSAAVKQEIESDWRATMQAAGAQVTTQDVKIIAPRPASPGRKAIPVPAASGTLLTAKFGPGVAGADGVNIFSAAGFSAQWTAYETPGAPEMFSLREQAEAKRAEAATHSKTAARYASDATIYVEATKVSAQEELRSVCTFAPTGGAGQFIAPGGGQMVGSVRRVSGVQGGAGCLSPVGKKKADADAQEASARAKQDQAIADRLNAEAASLDAQAEAATKSGLTRLHEFTEAVSLSVNGAGVQKRAQLQLTPIRYAEAATPGAAPNFDAVIAGWTQTAADAVKDDAKQTADTAAKGVLDLRGKANLIARNGGAVLDVGRADGVCPGDTFKLKGALQRTPAVRGADMLLTYDWVEVEYLARVTSVSAHEAQVEFLEKSAAPMPREAAARAEQVRAKWLERRAGPDVIATGAWAGVYGDPAAWTSCGATT